MANQFPTNNYDASRGGKQADGTDNTDVIATGNKGLARTGNSLYADLHYVDGDGFLYGLGMVKQRVLSKPATSGTVYDGLTDHSLKWSTKGSIGATLGLADDFLAYKDLTNYVEGAIRWNNATHKLWLDANLDMFTIRDESLLLRSDWIANLFKDDDGAINVDHISGEGPNSIDIGINTGRGLYIGNKSQTGVTYNKLNLNLFNQLDANDNDVNMSGLEFIDGDRTNDTAVAGGTSNAANLLRVKLNEWSSGSGSNIQKINMSGLEIVTPGGVIMTGTTETGGLSINYDRNGLTINGNGLLSINRGLGLFIDDEHIGVKLDPDAWLDFNYISEDAALAVTPNDLEFTPSSWVLNDEHFLALFGRSYFISGSTKVSDNVVGENGAAWEIDIPFASYTPASGSVAEKYQPGVINLGYLASGRNFALLTDSNGRAYVNVPSDNVDTWRPVYLGNTEKLGSGTNTRNLVFYSTNSINVDFDDEPHAFIFDVKLKTSMDSAPVNLSGLEIVTEVPQTQSNAHTAGLVVKPGLGLAVDSTGVKVVIDSVSEQPSNDSVTYNFKQGDNTVFSHTIGHADDTDAGLMSADDKRKLDAIIGGSDTIQWNSSNSKLNVKLSGNSLTYDSAGIKVHLHDLAVVRTNSTDSMTNYNPLYISSGGLTLRLTDANGLTLATNGTNGYLDIKPASINQKGTVQLSNAIDSTSETTAATSKAVSALATQLRQEMEGLNTEFIVVAEKPTTNISTQDIYLIPQTHLGQGGSYYEEWVYVKTSPSSTTYRWEKIGDTDFELAILTASEVNAIVTDVFGF